MFDHGHGYVRIRFPRLTALLAILHLPYMWLIQSGEAPHHPECTPTEAVIES